MTLNKKQIRDLTRNINDAINNPDHFLDFDKMKTILDKSLINYVDD